MRSKVKQIFWLGEVISNRFVDQAKHFQKLVTFSADPSSLSSFSGYSREITPMTNSGYRPGEKHAITTPFSRNLESIALKVIAIFKSSATVSS